MLPVGVCACRGGVGDDSRLQPDPHHRPPARRRSTASSRGRSASLRPANTSSPHGCCSPPAGHLRPPAGTSPPAARADRGVPGRSPAWTIRTTRHQTPKAPLPADETTQSRVPSRHRNPQGLNELRSRQRHSSQAPFASQNGPVPPTPKTRFACFPGDHPARIELCRRLRRPRGAPQEHRPHAGRRYSARR